jgi:hypothetical protein
MWLCGQSLHVVGADTEFTTMGGITDALQLDEDHDMGPSRRRMDLPRRYMSAPDGTYTTPKRTIQY